MTNSTSFEESPEVTHSKAYNFMNLLYLMGLQPTPTSPFVTNNIVNNNSESMQKLLNVFIQFPTFSNLENLFLAEATIWSSIGLRYTTTKDFVFYKNKRQNSLRTALECDPYWFQFHKFQQIQSIKILKSLISTLTYLTPNNNPSNILNLT